MMENEIKITSSVSDAGASEMKITGLSAEKKDKIVEAAKGIGALSAGEYDAAAKAFGVAAKSFSAALEELGKAVTLAVPALGGLNAVLLDVCERTYRATPWWRPLAKWRAWRDLKRARSSAPAKSSGTVVDELITKIEFEP